MSISNGQVDKLIKEKFASLEEAINATEKELLKSDNGFDKAKAAFQFGRVQQIYVELRFYVDNKGLLK